jgi:phenolic acid decarboxylase
LLEVNEATSVVVNVLPRRRVLHGTIFFPQWIEQDGSKTVLLSRVRHSTA